MKRRKYLSFRLGAIALLTWCAIVQAESKANVILPGLSVANVKLGSDPSVFQSAFSQRPGHVNSSQTGTFGEGCPDRIYYWSDLSRHTSIATAYLKGGMISQISVLGPAFSLPNGLKTGATEEQVKRAYPNGQMYVLLHSAGKVNGGKDVHYWVYQEAGIAFELDWWQIKKLRNVGEIDIFPKGSDYRPEGCISAPQQWKKLSRAPRLARKLSRSP